jgi:hypothetical protein
MKEVNVGRVEKWRFGANLCSGNHVEDEIKSLIYVEGTQSSKR